MKNQVSALELHYVVEELKFLVGGKINQVYHPRKNELLLQFHVPNRGKVLLRVLVPNVLYLTSYKPRQDSPSGFCAFLRKRLSNARLRGVVQVGFERVVEFVFEAREESFLLVLELFGKGNILLLKDDKILSAVDYPVWKDRAVRPGEVYSHPREGFNFFDLSEKELVSLLAKSDKDSLVRALAVDLGLGGLFAEEACFIAGLDKDSSPKKVDDFSKLFGVIDLLRNNKVVPCVCDSELLPFELKSRVCVKSGFGSFNELLDSEFTRAAVESAGVVEEGVKNKEFDKLRRIIDAQGESVGKLEVKESDERLKAELIYHNYQLVSDVLSQIRQAREKFSFAEIKEKLKGHKIIKDFNAKDKTVVADLK